MRRASVELASMVQAGRARSLVEAVPGFAPVEGSTLGEKFALGGALGGRIAGKAVEMP
jgi:hypothetical protein